VNAAEVIDGIKRLPDEQVERVYEYLFSTESELDRALAAFDRLPRKNRLTEQEILALPRARSARQ
jgi:hypothetical protein